MRLTPWLAAAAGVFVLAYRLFNLDLAPFIQDEAHFLKAAWAQLQPGGTWVVASPIAGTQGFTYGPSPIWFYGAVQTIFGPAARASITAMCAFVTLAHLALAFALTRAFKRGPAFFGLLAAFIGSLPYQFMWSRLAWDQLVNATTAIAVALIAAERPFKAPRLVALGLVIGIALSSHLMVAVFVIVTALVLLGDHLRQPRELGKLVAVALPVAVLFNVPYLKFLTSRPLPPVVPSQWGAGPGFFERLVQIPRVATTAGIEYFFDQDWADFVAYAGFDSGKLSAFAVAFVLLVTVSGLIAAVVLERGGPRRVAVLALVALAAYPLFYAWKQLPLEPHYQFPTWWIVPVGVAGLLSAAARQRVLTWVAGGAVAVFTLAQLVFVSTWVSYIRERGGTRGIHYSTPVEMTASAVRAACAAPEQTIFLQSATVVFPVVWQYHVGVEPLCQGKAVQLCGACPVGAPGTHTFAVGYSKPRGGQIAVEDLAGRP